MKLESDRLKKKNISVSLDIDVIEKIKYLSNTSFRSFSQYVNLVLAEHIKEIDKKEKKD